jgi:hypothetical protein
MVRYFNHIVHSIVRVRADFKKFTPQFLVSRSHAAGGRSCGTE